jgi:hypothetical protein
MGLPYFKNTPSIFLEKIGSHFRGYDLLQQIEGELSDQGSNLDFPESKSGVLPVTPSDNFPAKLKSELETPNLGLQR